MIEVLRPAMATRREPPDAELTARVLSAVPDEYARLILSDPDRFPLERLLDHARWTLGATLPTSVVTATSRRAC